MELSWLLWLLPHFTLGLLIGVLAGLPVLLYVVALYVSKVRNRCLVSDKTAFCEQ